MQHQKHREQFIHNHRKEQNSHYVKEVMYGGIDGIISTFAVIAGFSGAISGEGGLVITAGVVLLFGFANLFADAFSMGLGDYLSSRSYKKLYESTRQGEQRAITAGDRHEQKETIGMLEKNGFSNVDASDFVRLLEKNPLFWADFKMRYELESPRPDDEPWRGSLVTFISFICFGLIPLIPFLLFNAPEQKLFIAGVFTFSALLVLGVLRSYITRERIFVSILEVVGIGALASVVAFLVGSFF